MQLFTQVTFKNMEQIQPHRHSISAINFSTTRIHSLKCYTETVIECMGTVCMPVKSLSLSLSHLLY